MNPTQPPYEALSPSKECKESPQQPLRHPLKASDFLGIAVLLSLYFVQGIPLGLFDASIPFLLLARDANFADLGLLSFFSYPFAMKILFAPVQDAHFSPRFGKRKTYVVPCQYLLGLTFFVSAFYVQRLVEEKNIAFLTAIGFGMVLLAALQDIAVDGWQLTLLDESHLVWGSVAQSIGQTLGIIFGSSVFIQLNSVDFCNRFIYSEPRNAPVLELETFFLIIAVIILAITVTVHLFIKEKNPPAAKEKTTMWGVVKSLAGFFRNRNLKFLLFHLLVWRLGFSVLANTLNVRLIKQGFSKETLMNILTALIPLTFLVSFLVGRMNGHGKEMRVYLFLYILKIFDNIVLFFVMNSYGETTFFYVFFTISSAYSLMVQTGMFVVWGGFINRISDADMGGTYLTFLNSMHNLGNMWTGSLSYYLVDIFNYNTMVFVGWAVAIAYFIAFRRKLQHIGNIAKSEWSLKQH